MPVSALCRPSPKSLLVAKVVGEPSVAERAGASRAAGQVESVDPA